MITELLFVLKHFYFFALHFENRESFPKTLPREKEKEYLEIMHENQEAKHKVIEHNLRLVAYIVKKHYSKNPDQEELISIGSIGLIKAADTFDASRGNFSAYAGRCIQNEINMWLRKSSGKPPVSYLDDPASTDKNGDPLPLKELLKSDINVEDEANLIMMTKKLTKGLLKLSERERLVIGYRYGVPSEYAEKGQLSQKDTAKKVGICRSYVSRIEKTALTKLNQYFADEETKDND